MFFWHNGFVVMHVCVLCIVAILYCHKEMTNTFGPLEIHTYITYIFFCVTTNGQHFVYYISSKMNNLFSPVIKVDFYFLRCFLYMPNISFSLFYVASSQSWALYSQSKNFLWFMLPGDLVIKTRLKITEGIKNKLGLVVWMRVIL